MDQTTVYLLSGFFEEGPFRVKLVFASDLIFEKDPNTGHFANEEFNPAIMQNYLEMFDEIILCSPTSLLPFHKDSLAIGRTSRTRVSIQTLPPLSGRLSIFQFRFEAMRILQDALQQADVLIVRLPSETGLLAIQAAKLLNKPWAVEVVGTAEEHYDTSFGKLFSLIMKRRLRRAISHAPAAMYVTNRFLQRRYPCLGRMMTCANVSIPPIGTDIAVERLNRISSCFDRDVFHIGLHGSLLGHNKGIDTALKALNKVRQLTVKKVRLDIAGRGDASRWKRTVDEMDMGGLICFKGSIAPGPQMNQWLDTLDLYIQPSRHESSPHALLAAMGRGLPVFGSKIGGISELLGPEQLMLPEDDDRLAMLICDLVNDITKQKRLSARSLETVSTYTDTNLRAKRMEFFEYILNNVERCSGKIESV